MADTSSARRRFGLPAYITSKEGLPLPSSKTVHGHSFLSDWVINATTPEHIRHGWTTSQTRGANRLFLGRKFKQFPSNFLNQKSWKPWKQINFFSSKFYIQSLFCFTRHSTRLNTKFSGNLRGKVPQFSHLWDREKSLFLWLCLTTWNPKLRPMRNPVDVIKKH